MSVFAGPRTPFEVIKKTTDSLGSFWSASILSSMWQDTSGTVPAAVDQEVKRVDDLGGLGNHLLAPTGSKIVGAYTYVLKGPILRKENNQYYLEFDGDGRSLRCTSLTGNWPALTGSNSFGITMSVAFQTTSPQPTTNSSGQAYTSTGLSGTWLGNDALGNFGNVWWFGLRLGSEQMFYSVVRNVENTAWVTIFNEGDRYASLTGASNLNRKVIYTATGSISNTSFSGRDYIDGVLTSQFSNIAFDNTSPLPQPFSNTIAVGARSPGNDNWIAGRFYGGVMVAKDVSDDTERAIIERFLFLNCFK